MNGENIFFSHTKMLNILYIFLAWSHYKASSTQVNIEMRAEHNLGSMQRETHVGQKQPPWVQVL